MIGRFRVTTPYMITEKTDSSIDDFYKIAELIFIDQMHEVRSVHSCVVRGGGENATVDSENKIDRTFQQRRKKQKLLRDDEI